jgi:hypothetical protein
MSLRGRKRLWLAISLVAGQLIGGLAPAQTMSAPVAVEPRLTNAAPGGAGSSLALSNQSPVALFRELLHMSPFERLKFLVDRSPENKKLILAKVREYESFSPDERELRLRVTELHWYLWPLMHMTGTNRLARLAQVPAEDRQAIASRLEEWDKLSADEQRELFKNEAAIGYFTDMASRTDAQKTNILKNISAPRRSMLEAGVRRWQEMPEEQRQKNLARFQQFFELTPQEKEKALSTLTPAEQRQLEKTLSSFGQLTPERREQCVRSFEKFASLSLGERQQFLQNAERWKLMTPDQRQAWRDLVRKLARQPPLPPGLRRPPLPRVPAPRSNDVATTTTNLGS